MKFLNQYTKPTDYESLYLYLLGCTYKQGKEKTKLNQDLSKEKEYKKRLELSISKNKCKIILESINIEIERLESKKANLNINKQFEENLDELNAIKLDVNMLSENISQLELRKVLIMESKDELEKDSVEIDLSTLHALYNEIGTYVGDVDITFDKLVNYHNTMIDNKISYIVKGLPKLESNIVHYKSILREKLSDEKKLSEIISKSDTLSDLDKIASLLNKQYQKKGEYENILAKIDEAEKSIADLESKMDSINAGLMSEDFKMKVKDSVNRLNRYYSEISKYLYGEKYFLDSDIRMHTKTNQRYYAFSTFNENMSSGKKQGEILCFDIALIRYIKEQLKKDCPSFLLNDKKELMDDNQLLKVEKYAREHKIQLIFPMLSDKVPDILNNNENVILRLSQENKLFMIKD